MSTRTYMFSLKSIEPIKQAIGSKDRVLLAALLLAVGDHQNFQKYAEEMVMQLPPDAEPGRWNYLVEPLAKHFGLSPESLPLDDWKHYAVWQDYRKFADPQLTEDGRALLAHLESGRPFRGASVTHDGCLFAWLSTEETRRLFEELNPLDADELGELQGFHEELLESLQQTVDGNAVLFLGAS